MNIHKEIVDNLLNNMTTNPTEWTDFENAHWRDRDNKMVMKDAYSNKSIGMAISTRGLIRKTIYMWGVDERTTVSRHEYTIVGWNAIRLRWAIRKMNITNEQVEKKKLQQDLIVRSSGFKEL